MVFLLMKSKFLIGKFRTEKEPIHTSAGEVRSAGGGGGGGGGGVRTK
jgi:hypothetical protein